jgi:hypothetical protein
MTSIMHSEHATVPTRKKLEELGLQDVADDLEKKYNVPVSP